jgi:hypothetical protein
MRTSRESKIFAPWAPPIYMSMGLCMLGALWLFGPLECWLRWSDGD